MGISWGFKIGIGQAPRCYLGLGLQQNEYSEDFFDAIDHYWAVGQSVKLILDIYGQDNLNNQQPAAGTTATYIKQLLIIYFLITHWCMGVEL